MVQILDHEHLESLQCSRCRKYLSMFPVKNHSSRDVTCGRCSGIDADKDDSVRSTLYELVAEKYLFKCVNRFEGCKKLLRADETEDHEKKCVEKVFDCPKCEDGTKRHVLELIWHYKLQHPSSYLKKNSFQGNRLRTEDAMLYLQEDLVFFIMIRHDTCSNAIYLSAMTLTEVKVTQNFLILGKGSVYQTTEKKACRSITTRNDNYFITDLIDPVVVIFNLEVSKGTGLYDISVPGTSKTDPEESTVETVTEPMVDDFFSYCRIATVPRYKTFMTVRFLPDFEKYSSYELSVDDRTLMNTNGVKIDLTCSNCKQLLKHPTYECEKMKHLICYGCSTWCGICDCKVKEYDPNRSDPLFEVTPYLQFACKWKCGKYLTSGMRIHERTCELRIKKCPLCLTIIHLNFMKDHLLHDHQKMFCDEYRTDIRNFILENKNGVAYFLLNDAWCCLKWSYKSEKYVHWSNNLSYELRFVSLKENTKLGTIYNKSKCSYDKRLVILRNLHLYNPYLNFNYTW